jgi:Ca2+-binding RTX toxin-like protein/subtilisin family serine protease
MATYPSDPLFPSQWHLYNTSQPGMDLNVVRVWDDYTGRGVLVGVIDDGFDYYHPDLNDNYDASIDYDYQDNDGDPFGIHLPFPQGGDSHGTSVAGVIAAEAGNGIGGVGVAFGATVTGFRAISAPIGSSNLNNAITNALWDAVDLDVVNNSWGFANAGTPYNFYDNFNTSLFSQAGQAIRNAVDNGRGGLGTAIVFAAGNSRAQGDNTNYHNFQNSRFVTTVAALTRNGYVTSYSTPGASILVSAFGSEPASIVTTDRRGSAGYNNGYWDYNTGFNGTSAAAPMVSGVVALMLEANPNLGYRDIQEILAYSARQNDPGNQAPYRQDFWRFNRANNWNGGGLHVSHDYGFGLVDALAAVRLAETWQAQSRYDNEYFGSASRSLGWSIPDGFSGISDTITMSAGLQIDWVEVDLNITHPWRGDLVVTLISPNGTESVLVNRPSNGNDSGDNIVFNLSSTHHWGESSAGNWTLRVSDLSGGDVGILNGWRLNLYGDLDTADDTYIYTNEFANFNSTSRQTLNDASGIDTINAAAISSSTYLNLTPGSTNSKLAGRTLTIGSGTTIEKAFGGDGNDTIIGNSAANKLYGGRGTDILYGRSGNDTLDGGTPTTYDTSNDTLYGEAGNDSLLGGNGLDYLDGGTDSDTLNGWGGNDKLYGGYGTDILYGGSGNDTLDGGTPTDYDTSNDKLYGEAGNDYLLGGNGLDYLDGGNDSDLLNGWNGNDSLLGGSGNDTLVGGAGNDTLTGGAGIDRFAFNSRNERIDRIADFKVVDDTINVSAAGFGGGLTANAFLSAAQFIIGTAATTASQRFIYNSTNGGLFFDSDGIGSVAQLQISSLGTGLAMTNADIFVTV